MTIDEGRKPEGAPERSPKAGEGAPSGVEGNWPKRFSAQRALAVAGGKSRFMQNLGQAIGIASRKWIATGAKIRLTDS